jgi:hypothetical protein
MGFYIRPEYFEVIHYYYFSIGLFSFMCSIIFGFSAIYSLAFIILYVGQSSFGWYISWFMQKKMREFIIPNSISYAAVHVFFTFLVGGLTFAIWLLGALNEKLLITIILYINYFIFFLAVVWYMTIKLGVVKALFDVYDSRMMGNAKNLIIKMRDSRKDIFTKTLVSRESIKGYRTGSDPEIDELLIKAWKQKGSEHLLKTTTEIEIALCNQLVVRLRKWISDINSKSVITPADRRGLTKYAQMVEEYARASMEYEKEVASKVPE